MSETSFFPSQIAIIMHDLKLAHLVCEVGDSGATGSEVDTVGVVGVAA
jgi:hypothetical protein